jgi:hypothetical protein
MNWILLHPQCDLGFLPDLISENDPRKVAEQLADTYRHGGGWNPMPGWRLDIEDHHTLKFPGDPPMYPLAMTRLRNETILFYPHAFLCVIQPDTSFEVARVD